MAETLGPGSIAQSIETEDGVRLRIALREGGTRGLALVFQGRTEFCEKYRFVAGELIERGFSVATADWRGQGGSERALDNPRKGHVADFADYQRDVSALLSADAVASMGAPRLLIAHSMGGAIVLRSLLDKRLSPDCVVFSAPMWGLALPRSVTALTAGLAAVASRLGFGERYAIGGGDASYAATDPKPNLLTADDQQAAWLAEVTRKHADLALGGATWTWVREAGREMAALKPEPWLGPGMVVAGDDERVTSLDAMRARVSRDALEMTLVSGGRHELFFESPERRALVWEAIDAFTERCGV